LLDGQGLDEQWAGYDYYSKYLAGDVSDHSLSRGPVQGSQSVITNESLLIPEFANETRSLGLKRSFSDALRSIQYRDACYTKIPRALRFNDRISMMHSTELREPFLDHRLFELSFRQRPELKINNGIHKWLLREVIRKRLPLALSEAPKRPVQTPQREWLRGPLQHWVEEHIDNVEQKFGGIWFDKEKLRGAWSEYLSGQVDNSFLFGNG